VSMEESITATVTSQESVAAAPIAEAAPTTETPPSEGQAATVAAVESPVAKTEPTDYRKLYDTDPGLKQFVEGRAGDIAKRQTERIKRDFEKQRLSKAAEDPVEALSYAQERKTALDAEDSVQTGLQAKWASVSETITATAKDDPDWGKDYQSVIEKNRQEADKLFATDPDKFEKWVDKEIYKLNVSRDVDKALKERLPTLVEAQATDRTNAALRNMPVPLTGNGAAAGRFTLEQIERMDSATFAANEEAINRQYGFGKR
jgi:hypothetical protein